MTPSDDRIGQDYHRGIDAIGDASFARAEARGQRFDAFVAYDWPLMSHADKSRWLTEAVEFNEAATTASIVNAILYPEAWPKLVATATKLARELAFEHSENGR